MEHSVSWAVINLHRFICPQHKGLDLFLRAGDGTAANPWGGQASRACGPLNQVPMGPHYVSGLTWGLQGPQRVQSFRGQQQMK